MGFALLILVCCFCPFVLLIVLMFVAVFVQFLSYLLPLVLLILIVFIIHALVSSTSCINKKIKDIDNLKDPQYGMIKMLNEGNYCEAINLYSLITDNTEAKDILINHSAKYIEEENYIGALIIYEALIDRSPPETNDILNNNANYAMQKSILQTMAITDENQCSDIHAQLKELNAKRYDTCVNSIDTPIEYLEFNL